MDSGNISLSCQSTNHIDCEFDTVVLDFLVVMLENGAARDCEFGAKLPIHVPVFLPSLT